MAAWDGLRLAILIRWRHFRCPAIGYGIRYEFGIFDQEIRDGWQVEITDKWLRLRQSVGDRQARCRLSRQLGRPHRALSRRDGLYRVRWMPHRVVKGVAYDTPIQGYGVNNCNTLGCGAPRRSSRSTSRLSTSAITTRPSTKSWSRRTVTKVLYPNDEPEIGKRCVWRSSISSYPVHCRTCCTLTPPAPVGAVRRDASPCSSTTRIRRSRVAELMRLLVDERHSTGRRHGESPWPPSATQTIRCCRRRWRPGRLPMFGEMLPRHLEIIYEINRRFLDEVRARFPGTRPRVDAMSIIGEEGGKRVRMAHLATVGSHAVNGVAALHSELLKASILKDFYELWPERFSNKTNGVTPRRFLALSNPPLRALLDRRLAPMAGNLPRCGSSRRLSTMARFVATWRAIKLANKRRLADYVRAQTGIEFDPGWLFDIQVKRLHEYTSAQALLEAAP